MFKKVGLTVCFFVLMPIVYGKVDSCPKVEDIRVGRFQGWEALDANSNLPATQKNIKKFIRSIQTFYLAEHFKDDRFDAHCYYSGFLEVYLAKKMFAPDIASGKWYLNFGRWRCLSSGVEKCLFRQG